MTSPQERAEEAVAQAFGRAPARPVTKADQEAARAFGRKVPPLTEVSETASTPASGWARESRAPEVVMAELLVEYRSLRRSRLGESQASTDALVAAEEALISDVVTEGGKSVRRVRNPDRLSQLRERVEELRAQTPLSAGSSVTEAGRTPPSGSPAGGREVTQAEAEEAAASAFGRTGPSDVDDAVAAAFGRSTKGQA